MMKKVGIMTILMLFIFTSFWVAGCDNREDQGSASTASQTSSSSTLPQRIEYVMHAGAVAGSVMSYSDYLQAGETVHGYVELTGHNYGYDWSYTWTFQVLGPGGESLEDWSGHWVNNNYHDFRFTASYAGTYKIKVSHVSSWEKQLHIEIQPAGWGYSGS